MKKVISLFLGAIVALGFSACNNDDDNVKANLKCESSVSFSSYEIKTTDLEKHLKCDSLIDEFRNSCVDFANNHTYVYDLKGDSYDEICGEATEKYLNEKYDNDLNAAKLFVKDWQTKFLDFGTKNDVEVNIPLIFKGRGLYKIENDGLLKSDSLGTMVTKLGNSGAII